MDEQLIGEKTQLELLIGKTFSSDSRINCSCPACVARALRLNPESVKVSRREMMQINFLHTQKHEQQSRQKHVF